MATRIVQCQVCSWEGSRAYGSNGILVDPCPSCGHRVTYAATNLDDASVTPDSGVVIAIDPARAARRARLASNLEKARAALAA